MSRNLARISSLLICHSLPIRLAARLNHLIAALLYQRRSRRGSPFGCAEPLELSFHRRKYPLSQRAGSETERVGYGPTGRVAVADHHQPADTQQVRAPIFLGVQTSPHGPQGGAQPQSPAPMARGSKRNFSSHKLADQWAKLPYLTLSSSWSAPVPQAPKRLSTRLRGALLPA